MQCAFCGRDPYEYVDVGVGMVPVAVTCCEFGCAVYDHRNAPETELRAMFPYAKANDMNFVLFSTSGVHGCYTTIEEVEASLKKYGEDPDFKGEAPDDYNGDTVTFLIVHPRIVCLRYGNAKVTLADVPFLKALRASSLEALSHIGLANEN